ncbi:MAG: MBL fold metallo-hydrolase [Planctomycetes bacterium]|nr:MBL fold metallo-hydrolase [Planctomycetota bacterium]MBI3845034.1 MBL fold metallo-hydrolase [Planctomycetota bacterium]
MKTKRNVELTVLGSGTAIPRPKRAPSGYWLQIGDENLLLDSGAGTIARLADAGCPLERLTRVFTTHFHPDHTLDLPAILFALTNPTFGDKLGRLELFGPPGIEALVYRMRNVYGAWLNPPHTEIVITEVRPGSPPLEFPGYRVRTEKTLHTLESQGYRFEVEGGPIVAYTADTDVCPGAIALGRKADLLVTECSFAETDYAPGHLTPERAGQVAREAGCRRLLLTHFYESGDSVDVAAACRREFTGEILVASDGMRVTP